MWDISLRFLWIFTFDTLFFSIEGERSLVWRDIWHIKSKNAIVIRATTDNDILIISDINYHICFEIVYYTCTHTWVELSWVELSWVELSGCYTLNICCWCCCLIYTYIYISGVSIIIKTNKFFTTKYQCDSPTNHNTIPRDKWSIGTTLLSADSIRRLLLPIDSPIASPACLNQQQQTNKSIHSPIDWHTVPKIDLFINYLPKKSNPQNVYYIREWERKKVLCVWHYCRRRKPSLFVCVSYSTHIFLFLG